MSDAWAIPYGRYDESFKAIHSALSSISAPPSGERITRLAFTWDPNGTLNTTKAYDGTVLLFTLAFEWNADGTLKEVTRSDG